MSLSPEELAKLATLAHIKLSAEEAESLRADLNGIVGFVDRISRQEEATEITLPEARLEGVADTVNPSLPREVALSNAPRHTEGAVIAPPLETIES